MDSHAVESPTEPTASGRLTDRASGLAGWALLGLYVAAGLTTLRSLHWSLDLLTHMQAHLLVATGAVAVIVLCLRRWRLVTASLLLITWTSSTVRPCEAWLPTPTEVAVADSRRIRVLFWNTFVHNRDPQTIAKRLASDAPDVVAIIEWTPELGRALVNLKTTHPIFHEQPASGAFSIAIYSRIAGEFETMMLPGNVPCLRLRTDEGPLAVDVWAVHTFPPISQQRWSIRNEQLKFLAERLQADTSGRPRIVGGDFNVTPWSEHFQQFLQAAELVDTRPGFGYAATWPNRLGRCGIPIDQVAVDAELGVVDRQTRFASPHSDHAAVDITLELPRPPTQP